MKDFVPFEIAKNLKEKGFREECLYCYRNRDGKLYANPLYDNDATETYITTNELLYSHNSKMETRIDAPTISQVLKWLRKEKNLHIAIDIWGRTWGYDIMELTSGNSLHWTAYREDIKSYEDAALDGIEYVLDNLI